MPGSVCVSESTNLRNRTIITGVVTTSGDQGINEREREREINNKYLTRVVD